jgi:hypothetical protein
MRIKRLATFFFIGVTIILSIIGWKFFYPSKPDKIPFSYTFYGTNVTFPITVGESIKRYRVLPHRYNRLRRPLSANCLHNKNDGSVNEVYYVINADDYANPPSDSLYRDVYAISFCFPQKTNLEKTKEQLQNQFNRRFEAKKNSDSGEPYLQMKIYDYLSIIVDFYPENTYGLDKNIVINPNMWRITFCYNLPDYTIDHFINYERAYNAE